MCRFSDQEVRQEIARIVTMEEVSARTQLQLLVRFRQAHLVDLSGLQYQALLEAESTFRDQTGLEEIVM